VEVESFLKAILTGFEFPTRFLVLINFLFLERGGREEKYAKSAEVFSHDEVNSQLLGHGIHENCPVFP
jgi:hypothetical protein